MTHQIIKFNENAALKAGWPKDVVNTVRHLVASVGNQVGQLSLPEAVEILEQLKFAPLAVPVLPFSDPLTPAYFQPIPADDVTPIAQTLAQVEYLQTEVRQMAEQIAVLQQQINDLNQGTP